MPNFTCIATITAPDAESATEVISECYGGFQDAMDSNELPESSNLDFGDPVEGACPVIAALQGCARWLLSNHQSHTPEFAAACKALADAGFTHQRGLSLSASGYPTRGVLAEGSQKVVDNFVRALADMSFGDDDSPVSGGDLVDVVNTHFPGLHRIASRDFLPPRFLELQQRIKIGTRVLSIEGETSDTDTEDDVHTGPNAFGTVTNIFPDQECAYGVSFEASGVSVFLSLAELADEDRYDVRNPEDDDDDDDDPMGKTYCDRCNARLESGQIGLCDDCQDDEPVYADRNAVVNLIVDKLGSGGSRELAERVYDYMDQQGIVYHNGKGLVIEHDANIFQYAADLSTIDKEQ